jgi:uncharacterized membrane protein
MLYLAQSQLRRAKAMARRKGKTETGLEPNVAGLLCYVLGWVSGLVFLLLEKKNKFVRFHAIQSIIVFGFVNLVYFIFFRIPVIGWVFGWIVWVLGFVLWIVLMIRAYQGEKLKMPVAGDIADKNA